MGLVESLWHNGSGDAVAQSPVGGNRAGCSCRDREADIHSLASHAFRHSTFCVVFHEHRPDSGHGDGRRIAAPGGRSCRPAAPACRFRRKPFALPRRASIGRSEPSGSDSARRRRHGPRGSRALEPAPLAQAGEIYSSDHVRVDCRSRSLLSGHHSARKGNTPALECVSREPLFCLLRIPRTPGTRPGKTGITLHHERTFAYPRIPALPPRHGSSPWCLSAGCCRRCEVLAHTRPRAQPETRRRREPIGFFP